MDKNSIDSEKIKRFIHGNYSEEDESYVDSVFCDENRVKDLKNLLSRQFNELNLEDELEKKNLDHILYKIHYDINTRNAERKFWSIDIISKWTIRIASIILLPLLLFIGIQAKREANLRKEAWVEIKAPAWTRAQFSLPDGTIGWLNSNSSIKYNGNFILDRKIILTGEAFFDVYKDKKRPFMVSTNDVILTVLGTRFNIASYENEKNVEVVLEEGKLEFNNKDMYISYEMKPNDLVIYNKVSKNYKTEVVLPKKYLSWTEGKLIFRNDPMDVIARRLERWYNIDVEIKAGIADDIRLRATFIDDNLEEVLDLLKRSLPIDYRIENRNVKPDDSYAKKKVIITPRIKKSTN